MAVSYFLIAYKPDSSDSARGCTLETFSSGFMSKGNLSQETLVEMLTDLMFSNKITSRGEADYDFQILRDGVLIYDGIESQSVGYFEHYYDTTPESEYTDLGEAVALEKDQKLQPELKAIMEAARTAAEARYDKRQADIAERERKKVEAEKAAKEARDRATFERLSKQFSGEGTD